MVQAASGAYGSLPLGGETRKPSARTQNNYLVRSRTIIRYPQTSPRSRYRGRWALVLAKGLLAPCVQMHLTVSHYRRH
jgi:hypothetical protein